MCQISVNNLRDESLNKKLFLLMGSVGSTIHKDGWGFADGKGGSFRSGLSMYYTMDSGEILNREFKGGDGILLGHIRQASPQVPVLVKNTHPFTKKGISFVHNGKLTPKDEKNFVMEEELNEVDPKTHKPVIDEKTGKNKTVKIKRSDSLIFFEEFLKHYKDEAHFVDALKETMELFTGKFAMVFVINGSFYIVRGKTADLYISYLHDGTFDSKKNPGIGGWAINTSKEILDNSCILMSNLNLLEGGQALNFSLPSLLKEETIFKAEKDGLVELGEIKENSVPTQNYNYDNKWRSDTTNFTDKKGTGAIKYKDLFKMYKQIFDFMGSYSLSPHDIQNIFGAVYSASLLEATEAMLKHFCNVVLLELSKKTEKNIRRRLKKAVNGGYLFRYQYKDIEYPWMLNSKTEQIKFIEELEKKTVQV